MDLSRRVRRAMVFREQEARRQLARRVRRAVPFREQEARRRLTRRMPMLRWSFLRMGLGMRNFNRTGQIGDGREAAAVEYVLANARRGDVDDVLATIDRFAYERSFLINVGDEKGKILDAAVLRARTSLALELGTYCGYSALRIARAAPTATVLSVEFAAANAANARRIWEHAGVGDRVHCVVGTIGDGGTTLDALATEHGVTAGSVDFLFIDHDKAVNLDDLLSILARGWLHPGSIALADNMGLPGSPKYRAYMKEQDGHEWRTDEHHTHVEYQTLAPDLMLESEFLGQAAAGLNP